MTMTVTKALVLVGDLWGANATIRDGAGGILEQLARAGWVFTALSAPGGAKPCPVAAKVRGGFPMPPSAPASTVVLVDGYDALIVLPGRSHADLVADGDCLRLIREAAANRLAVGAFCRGVRALAAAGVLRGKRVTGHADYAGEYLAAGAVYLGYSDLAGKSDAPPPQRDGLLVTMVRGKRFRTEACAALMEAAAASREARGLVSRAGGT